MSIKKDRCDECGEESNSIAKRICRECDALFCERHAEECNYECQNHQLNLEPYLQ